MRTVHLTAVALQFLTRLPVRVTGFARGDLQAALGAFPVVGLVVAAVGVAVRAGSDLLWTSAVATVLAVLAMVVVTGAFHEDGLADAADGLWGGADAGRRQAIMRDSRLGTYGTVALVGGLALRIALLVDLPLAAFTRAVVVGHVLGRASTLVMLRVGPPVAPGAAAGLRGGASPVANGVAAASVAVCVAVALGWWGIVPVVVALLVTLSAARLAARRLGAVTGDVLGATNQVVHLGAMAAVVALVS